MARAAAAVIVVIFAFLLTTEAFACPDGCESASSSSASDQCNTTGKCIFCTGAVAVAATGVALVPLFERADTRTPPAPEHPVTRSLPLDHPPRRA